jgi:hypothetical protein
MSAKKIRVKTTTDVRVKLPIDLKESIRKFRAKRLIADQPITSDAKALLYLASVGLQHETLNA